MTDIDPASDIELRTVNEHVVVRVPLAGSVTDEWLRCYQRLAHATGVPSRPRHILTGPGSSSACQPMATGGRPGQPLTAKRLLTVIIERKCSDGGLQPAAQNAD